VIYSLPYIHKLLFMFLALSSRRPAVLLLVNSVAITCTGRSCEHWSQDLKNWWHLWPGQTCINIHPEWSNHTWHENASWMPLQLPHKIGSGFPGLVFKCRLTSCLFSRTKTMFSTLVWLEECICCQWVCVLVLVNVCGREGGRKHSTTTQYYSLLLSPEGGFDLWEA